MPLGHVIILLLERELFSKAVNKICQQGTSKYENFFTYVTNIDILEVFAYLRILEDWKMHLELPLWFILNVPLPKTSCGFR